MTSPQHTYTSAGKCKLCGVTRLDPDALEPCPLRWPDKRRGRRLLTEADLELITTLYRGGAHTTRDIAVILGRPLGTISTTIYHLRQRGQLERRRVLKRVTLPPMAGA